MSQSGCLPSLAPSPSPGGRGELCGTTPSAGGRGELCGTTPSAGGRGNFAVLLPLPGGEGDFAVEAAGGGEGFGDAFAQRRRGEHLDVGAELEDVHQQFPVVAARVLRPSSVVPCAYTTPMSFNLGITTFRVI